MSARNIQLWPGGQSVRFTGDTNGPSLMIETEQRDTWREATPEEHKAIKINVLSEMYAERDVWHCDSSLVGDLMKLGGTMTTESGDIEGAFVYENVSNLTPDPSDWTLRQCSEWLEDNGYSGDAPTPNPFMMTRAEMIELYNEADPNAPEEGESILTEVETDEWVREAIIEGIDDGAIDGIENWRDAVRDNATEAEIYEWWRVDPWLAARLNEIGECVLDNEYGEWWGRCNTGQSMLMDGVFQKIAAIQVES